MLKKKNPTLKRKKDSLGLEAHLGPTHRGALALLIGTRKGAFILRGNKTRKEWKLSGPLFLGHMVHHMVLDPRDRKTILVAARTGHLGPTIFRSHDRGKTWREATKPPAFKKSGEGDKKLVVDHVFWLSPGHPNEKESGMRGLLLKGCFDRRMGETPGRV